MTTSQITRFHHDFAKSDLILKKSMPQVPIEVRAEKRNSNWVIQMKNVAHLRQNRDPYPIIFSPCPACLVRWFHRIFNKTDQLENDGVKICIQSCPVQQWPVDYLWTMTMLTRIDCQRRSSHSPFIIFAQKNIWILGVLAKKSCKITSKSFKHHYVSSFDFRALKRMEQVCSHIFHQAMKMTTMVMMKKTLRNMTSYEM